MVMNLNTIPLRRTRLIQAAGALATFPAAAAVQPYLSDRYTICPFRNLTGWPCPLCGMTRAYAAASRGNWHLAWHYHPMWWLAPGAMLGIAGICLCDAARGTDWLTIARRAFEARVRWPQVLSAIAVMWAAVIWHARMEGAP
jgi:hypothetical protein